MTDDIDLVQRAQNGEMKAFRELVERYKQKVYYLSLDMTGNHHDAEDLSQEVFIKVFKYMKGFRGDAKFGSWLYRITVNTCIDQNRKKMVKSMNSRQEFDETRIPEAMASLSSSGNPEQKAESGLMQAHIEKAMRMLTDKERSVFVLRHYHHLKLNEISEILKITVGTVKSTLFRAIQRLQRELSFYKRELGLETTHE